jgi:hypothetical protein
VFHQSVSYRQILSKAQKKSLLVVLFKRRGEGVGAVDVVYLRERGGLFLKKGAELIKKIFETVH